MGKSVLSHAPGDLVNLTCIVRQVHPPRFIYWEHEHRVLNFVESGASKFRISDNLDQLRPHSANSDDQLSGELRRGEPPGGQLLPNPFAPTTQPFVSQLLIFDFDTGDAGNYSCRSIPQYSEAANVSVTISQREHEHIQLFFSNHYYSGGGQRRGEAWPTLLLIQLVLLRLLV